MAQLAIWFDSLETEERRSVPNANQIILCFGCLHWTTQNSCLFLPVGLEIPASIPTNSLLSPLCPNSSYMFSTRSQFQPFSHSHVRAYRRLHVVRILSFFLVLQAASSPSQTNIFAASRSHFSIPTADFAPSNSAYSFTGYGSSSSKLGNSSSRLLPALFTSQPSRIRSPYQSTYANRHRYHSDDAPTRTSPRSSRIPSSPHSPNQPPAMEACASLPRDPALPPEFSSADNALPRL